VNPKTRIVELGHIFNGALCTAIKDLPRWKQMQEFKNFDIVLVYLCDEESFTAPHDWRDHPRQCYSQLVKMGFSGVLVYKKYHMEWRLEVAGK
jgi:hypothetical protein